MRKDRLDTRASLLALVYEPAPPPFSCELAPLLSMATRATLTVEDVLGELDGNAECESDSDDDFDGYFDTGARAEDVEPVVEERMLGLM